MTTGRTFHSDSDRGEYLDLLAKHAGLEALKMLGWCLKPNHIRSLVIPRKPASPARAMMRTHAGYAPAVNRRHGTRSGHLWQSRFYSCLLMGDTVSRGSPARNRARERISAFVATALPLRRPVESLS
jgi:REP element-mobilizing transposase RayT